MVNVSSASIVKVLQVGENVVKVSDSLDPDDAAELLRPKINNFVLRATV